ncbi:MAG: single-stranded-DNA-specific exonuclease RecJ [Symbiobacteriaceae bacterium]|nr:single-stranded-DNA-specific exonuclease RecJ [Symbiobacteriaceae bacterium]
MQLVAVTWVKPVPVEVPEALVEAVGSRPLAELLLRRGFSSVADAVAFLTGGVDVDEPGLPDLEAGVACVAGAIIGGERICVYGDYDTDGVTSTTLLVDLLRRLGADVTYYIPNRFRDGYGMNARAVEALAAEGTALLLTCDCGIKSVAEVALAHKLGLRVVVTDHHELGPELPAAEAVINPKRLPEEHPCRMLPGVGTAYLFARQLLRALDHNPDEADRWLDLVAVGIIADVVPLGGANRELGRRGLSRLSTSPCPGLLALMTVAGLAPGLTEEDVAFQIVPRLNAAGRLADATLGVRLLLCEDAAEAADLARQLDQLNLERKRLTASVVEAAVARVPKGAGAILLYRPEWHEGVLGIAAGKLAEEYQVPALLMSRKHGTNVLVGSARAPEGFVLHEALAACGEHLLRHGGHAGAAGFSLAEEELPAFRAAVLEEIRRRSRPGATAPAARAADLVLPLAQVDRSLYDDLRLAAPFGEAHPEPVLCSAGVQLLSTRPIGAGDKHLRLVFRDGDCSMVGNWWGAGSMVLEQQPVDLFYRLSLNRWKGEETLQVVVEQLLPAAAPAPEDAELGLRQPAGWGPGGAPLPQPLAARVTLPDLVDRRGAAPADLAAEFPEALFFAEGWAGAEPFRPVDRYGLGPAADLVMLTPPPSPRLLDEAVARVGARRLVLAWPTKPGPEEERFLPVLMKLVAEAMAVTPYVSLPLLAVRTGELEVAVRLGLASLAESALLAIDEEQGDLLRLRRRTDGRGIKESSTLLSMKKVLGESRAYRRFLRGAAPAAIAGSIYTN